MMPPLTWLCRDRRLALERRPLIMGILNVTPDSFSDGGRYFDRAAAVAQGRRMAEAGADILDIGGESTRPGARPVAVEDECERIVPVVRALARETGAVLSVDTMKAAVAREALSAGAHIVNDVSALTHDPAMAGTIREFGAGAVLMHMRGEPRTMQQDPRYGNVVRDIAAYLAARLEAAAAAGLRRETLAVDPGIGFGKTPEQNVALLAALGDFVGLGRPVVIGLSRKSFLGLLTGRTVDERLAGSLAGLAFSVLNGAHVMRVHDVEESCDAVKVLAILAQAQREGVVRVE
jgi:dihydropteroate synthase